MKHKTFVRAFAAAGAVTLGAGSAWAADLTVVSWGGAYTASQQKAYGEPWEAKTGKKIHWENYNGGLGEIRTQVESGTVIWDIVDVLADEARVGCDEGLFEEIPDEYHMKTADGKSLDEDLMVPRPNKCVAPMIWWSYMMFYDAPAWEGKTAPSSIADFFNVADFPGKRGIHTWPQALVEMALVADGV
ncbi:MAG: extracellular solute-binding protein, partial [Chromatiales bacterium]|nr:extracellular solute-binding protein [Chromatiales bacterium]